jgi:2-succinyl-6-hydroxy-2,4-cyclohexadiene-1-carboxylate synthase
MTETVTRPTFVDSGEEEKPAVLLLHGFLGCKEDWVEISQGLNRSFRTITIDLPGHGATLNCSETEYTMPGAAELVIALLDHLRISLCHLIGYSMGGRIALYLAAHYPDRFERIVIESASAGLKTPEQRAGRMAHDDNVARVLEQKPLAEFLEFWYSQPLFESTRRDPVRFSQMVTRRLKNTPTEAARALRGFSTGAQPYLIPDLERLSNDFLFMAGLLDKKFSALAIELEEHCPNGTAWLVPDVGHTLHFEAPEVYIETVSRFLTEGI